jgi:mercuric ion transport protein
VSRDKAQRGNKKLKKAGGYLLLATAFLACPCHLVLWLPAVAGLLGGTALGANPGWLIAAATVYFAGALVGGLYLLGRRSGRGRRATKETQDCCPAPSSIRRERERAEGKWH